MCTIILIWVWVGLCNPLCGEGALNIGHRCDLYCGVLLFEWRRPRGCLQSWWFEKVNTSCQEAHRIRRESAWKLARRDPWAWCHRWMRCCAPGVCPQWSMAWMNPFPACSNLIISLYILSMESLSVQVFLNAETTFTQLVIKPFYLLKSPSSQ